jgi:hypothetical protein
VAFDLARGADGEGLTVQNILDQEVHERGDPVSYPAPGRALLASLRYIP